MFLFDTGFLTLKAPLFLDILTIYFAILPLLLITSIYYAIKKRYKLHFYSQTIILALTLVAVVIFEIGVRVTGGFIEFSQNTTVVSYSFLVSFLIVHIIIAIFAIAGWLYLYISTYKIVKKDGYEAIKNGKHKKIAKWIFASLTISSYMGVLLYIYLFL